jgi:hypothetical protein
VRLAPHRPPARAVNPSITPWVGCNQSYYGTVSYRNDPRGYRISLRINTAGHIIREYLDFGFCNDITPADASGVPPVAAVGGLRGPPGGALPRVVRAGRLRERRANGRLFYRRLLPDVGDPRRILLAPRVEACALSREPRRR